MTSRSCSTDRPRRSPCRASWASSRSPVDGSPAAQRLAVLQIGDEPTELGAGGRELVAECDGAFRIFSRASRSARSVSSRAASMRSIVDRARASGLDELRAGRVCAAAPARGSFDLLGDLVQRRILDRERIALGVPLELVEGPSTGGDLVRHPCAGGSGRAAPARSTRRRARRAGAPTRSHTLVTWPTTADTCATAHDRVSSNRSTEQGDGSRCRTDVGAAGQCDRCRPGRRSTGRSAGRSVGPARAECLDARPRSEAACSRVSRSRPYSDPEERDAFVGVAPLRRGGCRQRRRGQPRSGSDRCCPDRTGRGRAGRPRR